MCSRSRAWASLIGALWMVFASAPVPAEDAIATIERVKRSIVAIGTNEPMRSPPFVFRGTGFVIGDGTLVVTNAHVLLSGANAGRSEKLGIAIPHPGSTVLMVREVEPVVVDAVSDLALLRVSGTALPALMLGDSDTVKEGSSVLFTGFPIGNVLGPYATTHRGMVSAVAPLAIPQGRSADLDPKVVRVLSAGAYPVFQLDATAYPGNSGSPVYDPVSGAVLGVINLVFVKNVKESALSQPSGITYAIPAKQIQTLLQKYIGSNR